MTGDVITMQAQRNGSIVVNDRYLAGHAEGVALGEPLLPCVRPPATIEASRGREDNSGFQIRLKGREIISKPMLSGCAASDARRRIRASFERPSTAERQAIKLRRLAGVRTVRKVVWRMSADNDFSTARCRPVRIHALRKFVPHGRFHGNDPNRSLPLHVGNVANGWKRDAANRQSERLRMPALPGLSPWS